MEMLRYVVLVNGLLAVLSVAFYVLLRRETFFGANRLMLWLIVVVSFAGPLLELPDWRPQPVRDVMQRTARVIVPKVLPRPVSPQPDVTITFPNGKTYPAAKSVSASANWSWQQGLVVLYLLGMLGLLIRFIIQLFSLRKLIQHSAWEPYDDFTVIRNESIKSPFSFFNHVFINPLQHTPDELEQILRHERVHVQARHSLDMIGAELVCLVLWFNPTAYLFRHLLHQTLEFSADRAVLAEGIDAKAYQYNLLKVSLSGSGSVITNHFSGPTLLNRVGMMNGQQSGSSSWWRYLVLGMLVGIIGMACQHVSTGRTHKYIQETDDALFGIVTSHTSTNDLDTLRQALARRNISLSVKKLTRLPNGRIRQIDMKISVPTPGHPIEVSVGSALGRSAIPVIGLQCTAKGCQLGFVNDQFPERLLALASRERTQIPTEFDMKTTKNTDNANAHFGLYQVFFRNDFLESNYFGLRNTAIKMTPDYHLDLYPEYQNAVVFLDGQEISRRELRAFRALDLKKVVVFNGKNAVMRLGDERAKWGLILLTRLRVSVRDKYSATLLLKEVYPELFTQHRPDVFVHEPI